MAESLHILLGTSACLQWLYHSGERTVARGPLVLISQRTHMLWYSLEAPGQGTSYEYPQHMFSLRNKKKKLFS